MKKRLFLLFACALGLLAPVERAAARRPVIQWGILTGLNASDYSFRSAGTAIDNKLGWQAGMMTSLNFARFSLEPQVIFLHQSMTYADTELGKEATLRCNSIDLPILAAWTVVGPVRLFAGPVFTLMNKCSGGKAVFASGEDFDLSNLRSTCSYTVGIELKIRAHYRADLRYNGQFKAKSHALMPDGREGRMRSSFVSLNIGYFF